MHLQRLLRPDATGLAAQQAWSGLSEYEVKRLNQCFGGIARIDYMSKAEYELNALPRAINETVQVRSQLKHMTFPVTAYPAGAGAEAIQQTVHIIAVKGAIKDVQAYVEELARGGGNDDARFVQNLGKPDADPNKVVGWMSVNGPVAYITTDAAMFEKLCAVTMAQPYNLSQPARPERKNTKHNPGRHHS